MPLNFPDSPNNGDTYQGYTYNSTVGAWAPAAADTGGVTVYATVDDLPATGTAGDQAFVTASNRLYLWNGSGWYNIALINTTPTISGVSSSYTLASDGTPTTVTITATDPEGLPITYSIASDTSGNTATVTQNANVFTITPSTSDADAGTFSLTFRASDGVNIASAISEFTLQFKVVNSNYTTALITSVGTNNAVNNTFVDSSTNSHTITATGNATQTTFSPYRHGGYSTYFDGTGDYLTVPSHASLSLDADFTLEYWVYISTSGVNNYFFTLGDSINASGLETYLGYSGSKFVIYSNNSIPLESTTIPTRNTWSHVALVRSGSTVTLYLNGTSLGTFTSTQTFSGNIHIGAEYFNGAISQSGAATLNGTLSDLRIVKGTAVYTSAFTPPTERLTAITNTSLLTCHLPYIADGSTNGHAITINGNTKTEPFAPYDYETYSAADNGGSNFFTTSNDYFTVPYSSTLDFGSNDFTIEWWMNPTTTAGDQVILVQSNNLGVYGPLWIRYNGGVLKAWATTAGGTFNIFNSTTISGSIPANQWTHVAITRTSSGVWKTYLNGVQSYTSTAAGSLYVNSNDTVIGGSSTANFDFEGSLSDFRIVNGTVVYTADFTPPTTPLTAITNTSLLLNGTNAGIIDKSQSNKLLTLTGDTKSSTTQTKYLTSSMYFDGAGDNILTDVMAASGDFTVETWIYFDGQIPNPANQSPTFFVWGTTTFMLYATSTTGILNMIGNGSGLISSSTAMTADTWHHVAFAREGNTGRLFLDGNLEGSTTSFSTSINARAVIGSEENAGYPFKGYMSDVRVTHGLARYTANFTPPTAALQG